MKTLGCCFFLFLFGLLMACTVARAQLPLLGRATDQESPLDLRLAPVASTGPVSYSLADDQECVADEIHFSANGKYLANCFIRDGGHLVVWELASRKKICHLTFASQVFSVAFLGRKGHILLAGCENGSVHFCDYKGDRIVETMLNPDKRMHGVHALRVAKDCSFFLCSDRNLTIWDPITKTGKLIDLAFRNLMRSPIPKDLSNISDDKKIAVLFSGNRFRIIDLTTEKTELEVKAATKGVLKGIAFSPNGKMLATVEGYGTGAWLRMWRADNGSELTSVCAFEGLGRDVKFTPDGRYVLACGTDRVGDPGYLRAWDLDTGKNVAAFRCTKVDPVCFDISADGKWLATGGWEKQIKLYELNRVLKGGKE